MRLYKICLIFLILLVFLTIMMLSNNYVYESDYTELNVKGYLCGSEEVMLKFELSGDESYKLSYEDDSWIISRDKLIKKDYVELGIDSFTEIILYKDDVLQVLESYEDQF